MSKKNNWKDTAVFTWYDLQKLQCSPRVPVLFLLVAAVILYSYQELAPYLADAGETMNLWELYILSMNGIFLSRFSYIGILALLADVPFLEPGLPYYMLRSRRKPWYDGQIGYILVMVFAYNLFLLLIHLACTGGHITVGGGWSELLTNSVSMRAFPDEIDYFNTEAVEYWMKFLGPSACAGITFLWNCFWMAAVAMLFMTLALGLGQRTGWLMMAAAFALDLAYRQDIGGKILPALSPITLGRWMDLGQVITLPALPYAVFFFLVMILASDLAGSRIALRCDFATDRSSS